jgi:hypothetical protein
MLIFKILLTRYFSCLGLPLERCSGRYIAVSLKWENGWLSSNAYPTNPEKK